MAEKTEACPFPSFFVSQLCLLTRTHQPLSQGTLLRTLLARNREPVPPSGWIPVHLSSGRRYEAYWPIILPRWHSVKVLLIKFRIPQMWEKERVFQWVVLSHPSSGTPSKWKWRKASSPPCQQWLYLHKHPMPSESTACVPHRYLSENVLVADPCPMLPLSLQCDQPRDGLHSCFEILSFKWLTFKNQEL